MTRTSSARALARPATGSAIVAVATGALLAWHPTDPTHATQLADVLGRWLAIHLGLLLAMPLLALGVIHLLRGIETTSAKVARTLIIPAAAFYAAFDALLGIGTGVLVDEASRLPPELREGAVAVTQVWWEVPQVISWVSTLAIATWTVAIASAGIAAHRHGLGASVAWPLVASSVLFALGHPGATGALAMVALAAAMVAGERARGSLELTEGRSGPRAASR
jgi:hypothetical protein